MYTKVDIPQLPEQEARDFCSNIALKYNATYKNIPHIENLSNYEKIYGEDTIQWLSEFLAPLSTEVYIVEDSAVVLKFPNGRNALYYAEERGWGGYEYFIVDPASTYLWGIWHEEAIYACGSAVQWLQKRKMKFLELLGVEKDNSIFISEPKILNWGKTLEFVGEIKNDANEVQQFTVSFENCSNIFWNPPTVASNQIKVSQTYFGRIPCPSGDRIFFSLRGNRLNIRFDYRGKVIANKG
jgi:hypothetical protein